MNTNRLLNFSIIATIAVSGAAFSLDSKANDLDRLAISLCESAKSDDRRTMRKKLDGAKIRLSKIYDGLRCGSGGSLLKVATTNGSMDAAKYIMAKAKKQALKKTDEGVTIIQYTEQLVASGDASKQEFLDFYKSKI